MSERGLVVRQDSLAEIEAALTTASESLRTRISDLLQEVNDLTPGWDPTSESYGAHREHQQKLTDGVTALTEQLDKIRTTLADYREDARQIELDNVTIVN